MEATINRINNAAYVSTQHRNLTLWKSETSLYQTNQFSQYNTTLPGSYYLSFLAFSAKALNFEEFFTAAFLFSSIRLWSDSPRGLFAMALTAVKGIAENIKTPASFPKKKM